MTLLQAVQSQRIRINWIRWLSILAALAAAGYLLLFFVLAGLRSVYPFELEWIEGADIDQIAWLLRGNPAYPEPSIFYLPLLYTPLYFYLSAALSKIIGLGFFAPRLLSILAALGCLVLLYRMAARDSERPLPGLLAAGIYAASFRFTGAWLDLAKIDSLFLFLVLAAFYIGRRRTDRPGQVLSGLLFVLAYFTKQLALPILLVLAPLALLESRGRSWLQWSTAALLGIALFWLLDRSSAGWFSFYTVEIIAYHQRVLDFWVFWRPLLSRFWPAALLSLLYLVPLALNWRKLSKPEHLGQNFSLVLALILASWSVFLKVWTYDNGFMPAVAGLALAAGFSYGQLLKLRPQLHWDGRVFSALHAAALVLFIFQFAALAYNPLDQLPTRRDRQAGEQFVRRLSELPGEVFVFNHGFLNQMAGKQAYLHSTTYGDVAGGSPPPAGTDLARRREQVLSVFRNAVSGQYFDWVIVNRENELWLPYYVPVEDLFSDPQAFYPVTGAASRPEVLLAVNPVARGGQFPLGDPTYEAAFIEGWNAPDSGARRTAGLRAALQVALETGADYRLAFAAQPGCRGDSPSVTSVRLLWNDQMLGNGALDGCGLQSWTFDLPAGAVRKGMNDLVFEIEPDPASVGDSTASEPGLRFTSLAFTRK